MTDSRPLNASVASPAGRGTETPVFLNAHARAIRSDGKEAVLDRVRAACEAAGLSARVEIVEAQASEAALRAAVEAGARAVVVGGGDGTVRTAAQVLAGSDVALGILPLGTLNHFARDLGLPADLAEAARVIAQGSVRAIDVGDLDGEVFVNNSSLGLYPEMVRVREAHERRFAPSRVWSVVRASWRTFWRFPTLGLEVLRPPGIGRVISPVVFVGNGEYVLGSRAGTRRSIEEGVLFLCMLTTGRWRTLWLAVRSLFTAVPKEKHMRCLFVEDVSIALARGHAWVSLDGEVRKARGRLRYRVRPKALRVLAPPRQKAPAS